MSKPDENNSSSSGDFERVTIAYAESAPAESVGTPWTHETTESSDTSSSSTSEQSTPNTMYSDTFRALDVLKDMQMVYGYEPIFRTMSTTDGPKTRAQDYLKSNLIFQLFSFLMTHLLIKTPEEPIPYLMSLVDRCLEYRDRGGDPPIIFDESHIRSVFSEFDPLKCGFIHYSYYICCMNILGLTDFNITPEGMDSHNQFVSIECFVYEAKQALLIQLDRILGKAQPTALSKETMALVVDSDAENMNDVSSSSFQLEGELTLGNKESRIEGQISNQNSTITQTTYPKTFSDPSNLPTPIKSTSETASFLKTVTPTSAK